MYFVASANEGTIHYTVHHREITLIELQSLVVFGCAALLFMVGATASTHDREEGWDDFLFVYTELSHRQDSNLQPCSNSGEEKDSLDHSATGHFI